MPVLRGVALGWHPFVKQRGAGSIFIRLAGAVYISSSELVFGSPEHYTGS